MENYGLTEEEQKLLKPYLLGSYGICESQEGFMRLVQIPECGGFNLMFADKLRKSIAKKNPAAYFELQKEYFEKVKEKGLSKNLCNYVWNVLVATSRGYGFNLSHTLAYSLIALQEMNLAFKYPIVFWNCACLITDSGGMEDESNEEEDEEEAQVNYSNCVDFGEEDEEDDIEEEDDDDEDERADTIKKNKKKKNKSTNYDKIANAIGKMRFEGISVMPPDINRSGYTFSPDVENNTIIYGLSGITKIGEELVKNIIDNRPYYSLKDFVERVKVNKTQVINLIKAGAFDWSGDRVRLMQNYVDEISDKKQDLNLRNMQMLITYNLIPEEMDFYRRLFNFNKYLKNFKEGIYYLINEPCFKFLEENYDIDMLVPTEDGSFKIEQAKWDKIYKKDMGPMRNYIKAHKIEMLQKLNDTLFNEQWKKNCLGTISKWEMDSISFYYHEHELAGVRNQTYGFVDFFKLPEEPEIENVLCINGRDIPLYKLHRICGTVLSKNKNKNTVSILTTSGVVNVKIWNNQFVKYDKQISEKTPEGKKKVIEKSWFSRGNKIAFVGIRRGDVFIPKIYKNSAWSEPINLIVKIDEDKNLFFQRTRKGDE